MEEVKEIKRTPKMNTVIAAVEALGGKAFAPQVLRYLDDSQADRADLKTIKSITSTLGYVARAGLATKSKSAFESKLLTEFQIEA